MTSAPFFIYISAYDYLIFKIFNSFSVPLQNWGHLNGRKKTLPRKKELKELYVLFPILLRKKFF